MAQTFSCPSCGAPLEPDGDKTTIICKYCNESVIVPADLRTHVKADTPPVQQFERPVVIDLEHPSQRQYTSPIPKKKKRSGRLITILMVLFFGIICLVAFGGELFPMFNNAVSGLLSSASGGTIDTQSIGAAVNTVIKPDVRVQDPVVLAPLPDTQPPDFLAPVWDRGADVNQIALVDGKKHTIIWRTDDLGKEYNSVKVFPTDKQVYLVDQTTLTALDRQTGKTKWKANLDNGLGYCKTCLGQYQNTVVLVLKDGTVQAVDALSGKLTWQKTLNNTNADLFTAGGKPAVEEKEDGNINVFYIFDPLSGRIAQRIEPGCPAKKPDGLMDDYVQSEDGKSLVLFYESCVQRISLPDGKVLSEILSPQNNDSENAWPMAWFATKNLVTQNMIYYTMNGSQEPLNQVDINKGNAKLLIADKKYSLTPVFVSGNVLVAEAVPGFDSNQHEYWGVDTQTGKRLWQYALKGQGSLSHYEAHATSKGAFVVQCREDPDGCTWAVLDPQTGVGSNPGTGPGGPFIDVTWGKDTLYLVADGSLTVIDALHGQQLYQFP